MSDRNETLARQQAGLEHLVGMLLAYAQSQPSYAAEDLLALLRELLTPRWQADPYDPFLDPFERLEAMLRCQLGQPVVPDGADTALAGFPMPALTVLQTWQARRRS